jgi:hypothetical protein
VLRPSSAGHFGVMQDMLKGMDADGRAKMEELLKNVRTKGPAGSGGLFGALLGACTPQHSDFNPRDVECASLLNL